MTTQRKTIVIVGNNGFIGSNLVMHLRDEYDVIGFTKTHTKKNSLYLPHQEIQIISKKDITDYLSTHKIDTVIYCAGSISWNPDNFSDLQINNVEKPFDFAEIASRYKVSHFIYISAGARWGLTEIDAVINESSTSTPRPDDPYAYSKYLAENAFEKLASKMRITILYPATVYGAGDKKLNSGSLIKLLKKIPLPIAFPGVTSWLSINDLCHALKLILKTSSPMGIGKYILSSENISYKELFNRILNFHRQTSHKQYVFLVFPFNFKYFLYFLIYIFKICPWMKSLSPFLNKPIVDGFFGFRRLSSASFIADYGEFRTTTLENELANAVNYYQQNGLW